MSFLIIFSSNLLAQNINGTYKFKPKSNSTSKPFEIEITNDSIYVLKSENKAEDNGKVRKKGNFYYLVSCCLLKPDTLNVYNGLPVKITNRKIKVYGYKPKKTNLTKAFELTKAGT